MVGKIALELLSYAFKTRCCKARNLQDNPRVLHTLPQRLGGGPMVGGVHPPAASPMLAWKLHDIGVWMACRTLPLPRRVLALLVDVDTSLIPTHTNLYEPQRTSDGPKRIAPVNSDNPVRT